MADNNESGETGQKGPSIADDLVVTKYKMAAEIVNRVLKETIALCKVGASVREISQSADAKLDEETQKAFKKDKKVNSVAFKGQLI